MRGFRRRHYPPGICAIGEIGGRFGVAAVNPAQRSWTPPTAPFIIAAAVNHLMRESQAAKRARAIAVARRLHDAYPLSTCALEHDSPFQLLVATVLSAQTTDVAVNRVTPALFGAFPTPAAMAAAPHGSIERIIDSIGLWRAKAKALRGLARVLLDEFDGDVPRTVEEIMRCPGVGKKTATAVLGTAHAIPAGVTVDTHMLRVNRLLGLSSKAQADKMAADLERLLPPQEWTSYTHRVIDHGRLVCVARRPRCGVCPVSDLCPSARNATAGYRPKNDDREPASARGLSWLSRRVLANEVEQR